MAEGKHMIAIIEDDEHANEESDLIKQYIIYFRIGQSLSLWKKFK